MLRSTKPEILSKAFKVYIRPGLEYASVVWSLWTVADKNLLESVQRRYTSFVYHRCSLDPNTPAPDRLLALGPTTLERRRLEADLVFVHKI